MSRVPGDAIHAAAVAMAQVETGPDGTEPNDIDFLLARIALEAAAPHMLAEAKAAALEEAAGEVDSLEYLVELPGLCSAEDLADYEAYANAVNVQEWLRARAATLRGGA